MIRPRLSLCGIAAIRDTFSFLLQFLHLYPWDNLWEPWLYLVTDVLPDCGRMLRIQHTMVGSPRNCLLYYAPVPVGSTVCWYYLGSPLSNSDLDIFFESYSFRMRRHHREKVLNSKFQNFARSAKFIKILVTKRPDMLGFCARNALF